MFNDDSATALLPPPCEVVFDRSPPPIRTEPVASTEPGWIRRGHIPGLDGLRAIAVLLILAVHGCQTAGFPEIPYLKSLLLQGAIGVDIFFVISGFLITTLLARELERDGSIQLRRFYVRRFLRIVPAYAAFVAVVAIFHSAGYFHLQTRDWIAAGTYTTNFLYHPSWELGHAWSLSIEEHFYFLWPLVLCLGGRVWGWRVGLSWMVGCAAIRCAIAAGLPRYLFPASSPYSDVTLCALMAETWTFTRLDTITMGSLLALCCRTDVGRAWLDRLTTPHLMVGLLATLCVSMFLMKSGKYTLCLAYTVNSLCIALLMWGLIRSQGTLKTILAHPVLTAIGLGSYSIYLWQQLFAHPHHAGWVHQFPQNIAFALLAATASFWIIECPFNRLKDRLAA